MRRRHVAFALVLCQQLLLGLPGCPCANRTSYPAQSPNKNAATGCSPCFSPASFGPEPIGSFDNVHRNPYHGPGILNTNMIIAKNIAVSSEGGRYIQLRMESDNVFNHTQLNNPTGSIAFGNFGFITSAVSGCQTQLAAKIYLQLQQTARQGKGRHQSGA